MVESVRKCWRSRNKKRVRNSPGIYATLASEAGIEWRKKQQLPVNEHLIFHALLYIQSIFRELRMRKVGAKPEKLRDRMISARLKYSNTIQCTAHSLRVGTYWLLVRRSENGTGSTDCSEFPFSRLSTVQLINVQISIVFGYEQCGCVFYPLSQQRLLLLYFAPFWTNNKQLSLSANEFQFSIHMIYFADSIFFKQQMMWISWHHF